MKIIIIKLPNCTSPLAGKIFPAAEVMLDVKRSIDSPCHMYIDEPITTPSVRLSRRTSRENRVYKMIKNLLDC